MRKEESSQVFQCMLHRILPVVVCIFTIPLALQAQSVLGVITGTIFDPQHAIVAGAKVMATNLGTNVIQTTLSTGVGAYSLVALQPGSYRVTVEAAGFETAVREPIELAASTTVTVDMTLAIVRWSVQNAGMRPGFLRVPCQKKRLSPWAGRCQW